jgi:hypothetical protein
VPAKVMTGAARGGRRNNRRPLRLSASLVVVAVLAAPAAGAFAYWTGAGGGSGDTMLPDTQHVTFSPGTATAQLYPGGTASVALVAHNPNSFFVQIPSITLDASAGTPFTVDAAHSGCDVSVLSFVTDDNGGAGWSVPPMVGATDGSLAIDLSAAMHMTTAAADACQGATFTVRVSAPVPVPSP